MSRTEKRAGCLLGEQGLAQHQGLAPELPLAAPVPVPDSTCSETQDKKTGTGTSAPDGATQPVPGSTAGTGSRAALGSAGACPRLHLPETQDEKSGQAPPPLTGLRSQSPALRQGLAPEPRLWRGAGACPRLHLLRNSGQEIGTGTSAPDGATQPVPGTTPGTGSRAPPLAGRRCLSQTPLAQKLRTRNRDRHLRR